MLEIVLSDGWVNVLANEDIDIKVRKGVYEYTNDNNRGFLIEGYIAFVYNGIYFYVSTKSIAITVDDSHIEAFLGDEDAFNRLYELIMSRAFHVEKSVEPGRFKLIIG